MLKGISSNTSSKLNNLEGDMKNEICSLLQLYLEVYPVYYSADLVAVHTDYMI